MFVKKDNEGPGKKPIPAYSLPYEQYFVVRSPVCVVSAFKRCIAQYTEHHGNVLLNFDYLLI